MITTYTTRYKKDEGPFDVCGKAHQYFPHVRNANSTVTCVEYVYMVSECTSTIWYIDYTAAARVNPWLNSSNTVTLIICSAEFSDFSP